MGEGEISQSIEMTNEQAMTFNEICGIARETVRVFLTFPSIELFQVTNQKGIGRFISSNHTADSSDLVSFLFLSCQ